MQREHGPDSVSMAAVAGSTSTLEPGNSRRCDYTNGDQTLTTASNRGLPGRPFRKLRSPKAAAVSVHTSYLPNEAPVGLSQSKEDMARKGLQALQAVEIVKLAHLPEAPVLVLGGGADGTVYAWNGDNNKLLLHWEAHSKGIITLKYEMGLLFSQGRDGYVRIWRWSFSNEEAAQTEPAIFGEIPSCEGTFCKISLVVNATRKACLLAVPSNGETGSLSIWKVSLKGAKTEHLQTVEAFSDSDGPKSSFMACLIINLDKWDESRSCRFFLVGVDDGGYLHSCLVTTNQHVKAHRPKSSSPDTTKSGITNLLAKIPSEQTERESWDVIGPVCRQQICGTPLLSAAAADPNTAENSVEIFCGQAGNHIYRLKLKVTESGEGLAAEINKCVYVPTSGIGCIACRPDSKLLICGGWDNKIRLFSRRLKQLAVLDHHCDTISAVGFIRYFQNDPETSCLTSISIPSSNATLPYFFASSDQEGSIALWDVYANE